MRNLTLSFSLLSMLSFTACHREDPGGGSNPPDSGVVPTTGPAVCFEGATCEDMAFVDPPATPDAAVPWTPSPPGDQCDQQSYALTVTGNAPNIHLVIDRSGSMSLNAMTGLPPVNGSTSKWDDLTTTMHSLLLNYGTSANLWGMSIFPTTYAFQSCVAGDIAVPLMPPVLSILSMEATLAQFNSSNLLSYNGKTPTTAAMQGVLDHVPLNATDRNNYVVLMTDGMPNCAGTPESGVTPIITSLANHSPSVRTFVIGFGSDLQSNPALLNDWAVAGHTPRAGSVKYYQAADATALQQAFQDIVIGVASCTFTITNTPADPSLVVGTLNGQPIAVDLANGFTYDVSTQSVTFHGSACQMIQNDPNVLVEIIYGCPAVDAPVT